MTSKESIFISYRRSDSQDVVGRIDDYLTDHFGREHVFLDRNSIDYGAAFPDRLKQAMQDCKVVLVVIGSIWVSVKDAQGRQRLASSGDWVRQEVELALNQGLYVIPVLLDNTTMPSPSELPASLHKLLERNAFNLITRGHTEYFKTGMRQIIQLIEERVPDLRPAPPMTFHPFEVEVVTLQIQAGL
ncbi:MAG: toll/interleukin-1 receptor domain-containing protein, partial [Oculatellaceae cyanobacterium bins.114]|nr:toll/interleukin-1 receptor domain-containing protein [Oculatellaceae cyanobacterium bins.114]